MTAVDGTRSDNLSFRGSFRRLRGVRVLLSRHESGREGVMTQEQLGRQLGVSARTVIRMEKDQLDRRDRLAIAGLLLELEGEGWARRWLEETR